MTTNAQICMLGCMHQSCKRSTLSFMWRVPTATRILMELNMSITCMLLWNSVRLRSSTFYDLSESAAVSQASINSTALKLTRYY
jgi:hypothetical protein